MRLDAAQVERALKRIAHGNDERPPAFHRLEPYRYSDGSRVKDHWSWNISGDCLDPVHREMFGAPYIDKLGYGPSTSKWLEIWARCRKCRHCLKQRATLWRGRLLGELRQSQEALRRTWFITLTSNPSMRTWYKWCAAKRYNERGKGPKVKGSFECADFEDLSESERFGMIHQEISADITRYLKRLRQEPIARWRARRKLIIAGAKELHGIDAYRDVVRRWETEYPCPKSAKLRYVIVTEAHKVSEVFPHYHILIHEVSDTLTADSIKAQWRSRVGFIDRKLVRGSPEGMLYLCKYLSKDNRARVRASIGYGRQGQTLYEQSEVRPDRSVNTTTPSNENPKGQRVEKNPQLESALLSSIGNEGNNSDGIPIIRLSVRSAGCQLSKGSIANLLSGHRTEASGASFAPHWQVSDGPSRSGEIAVPTFAAEYAAGVKSSGKRRDGLHSRQRDRSASGRGRNAAGYSLAKPLHPVDRRSSE